MVTAVLLLALMTAQTVPLLLPRCREVSGGGEGGSCWAGWRTVLPDDRSGGWQRQPGAGGSPRARSPWPTWLWGTAFSSCLVTLPAPGPPIQTRDDRRPRWLHLSDLRDCPCRRFRAPSARSRSAPTHGSYSSRFYDHRSVVRSANATKMTTTKGPRTCRRVARTEPGTPACPTSCTRHYWPICLSLSPWLAHATHPIFGRGRDARSRSKQGKHQNNQEWPYGRGSARDNWCWDAILLPSRDHADSLNTMRDAPFTSSRIPVIRPLASAARWQHHGVSLKYDAIIYKNWQRVMTIVFNVTGVIGKTRPDWRIKMTFDRKGGNSIIHQVMTMATLLKAHFIIDEPVRRWHEPVDIIVNDAIGKLIMRLPRKA